jgi:2-polyprenyl-3-methyl-5-hydroxy-6-metoxy-1,4-benzoquinol methylase
MTTDYDPIAEQYKRSKQQPWRTYIEAFTLMEIIGDPQGKSVLDIACGEGFYSRLLRQYGARKVVGIDLSARMIALVHTLPNQIGSEIAIFGRCSLPFGEDRGR